MFLTFLRTNNNKANQDQTATLIDHVLTSLPGKVSQLGVIDLGLSYHDLIYCTRKASLPKSHKHNELFFSLNEKVLRRNIFEKYKRYCFSKLSDRYLCIWCLLRFYICRSNKFHGPSKTDQSEGQPNSKPWFDDQIMSAIATQDKL